MRQRVSAWLRQLFVAERGAVLVMAALGFTTICGFAGLSLDVGKVAVERRELQNAVDAAALAGSQQLPASPSSASSDALVWLAKNGVTAADGTTVAFSSTYTANDTISVTADHDFSLFVAPLFGKDSATVGATSKAVVGSMTGGNDLVPFGLLKNHNPCFSNGQPLYGVTCTMKYGASGDSTSDFGALSIDGSGASTYRDTIGSGSTSTWSIGAQVATETGNMSGPTSQGLGDRLAQEPTPGCGDGSGQDTFDEVFTLGPGGFYKLNCPTSPRVIMLPVIDKLDNPNMSTILDFALLYLEDYQFTGGHSEIRGRLAQVNVSSSTSAIFGAYRTNGLRMIRLTQ